MEIRKRFKELLQSFRKIERDITESEYYMQVWEQVEQLRDFEYPWVVQYMFSEAQNYVIITDRGLLFRLDITFDGDVVTLGEPREVRVAYPDVEARSNVFRDAVTGELKFLSVAASSMLNRVGEIDSRKLFDSFEENFADNEAYVTFYHMGEQMRFGTVKGCARYENQFVTWGVIDESTLFGSVAEERFRSGEWGISIGYKITDMPKIERIGDAEILVFDSGVLVEQSVLLEKHAANYLTMISGLKDEENRIMGKDREQMEALALEFVGEDKKEQVAAFMDQLKLNERKIVENGVITRDGDLGEAEVEVIAEAEITTEFVLDDNAISAITAQVFKQFEAKFTELADNQVRALEAMEKKQLVEAQKKEQDQEDRPAAQSRKITIGYRPSFQDVENAELTVQAQEMDFTALRANSKVAASLDQKGN